jgi:hypothetical protein
MNEIKLRQRVSVGHPKQSFTLQAWELIVNASKLLPDNQNAY